MGLFLCLKFKERKCGRLSCENLKKQMAESIWLGYFNRVLFERGVITEAERNKMALKIEDRKTAQVKGVIEM